MRERTFEEGDEILRVGDLVTIFVGSRIVGDAEILKIGTKRLAVKAINSGKVEHFSKATRTSERGGRRVFRTPRETEAVRRRDVLVSRLAQLGIQPGDQQAPFREYRLSTLEKLVALLEIERSEYRELG